MVRKRDFSNASVLVIGNVMLDKYWFGVVNKISPKEPVSIVKNIYPWWSSECS